MAGRKNIVVNNDTPTGTFSFGRSGNTLTSQAIINISVFSLREVTEDPIKGRTYGDTVEGKEAIDIVTSHNVAHKEQILARLKKEILNFKAQREVTPVTRNIAEGESVQDRAARYIRGVVLGAVNTCPTKLSVGGKTYIYEKRNVKRYLNPSEAIKLLNNEAYVGSSQGAKVEFSNDEEKFNIKCVDKDTFEQAIKLFCEELKPRIEGQNLYLDSKLVAIFSAIDSGAQIISGASSFDETKVSVSFS